MARFMHGSGGLTDRRSAAINSADRTRPSCHGMPPDGNQGQLKPAVAGPLQRLVGRRRLVVGRPEPVGCGGGDLKLGGRFILRKFHDNTIRCSDVGVCEARLLDDRLAQYGNIGIRQFRQGCFHVRDA